MATSGVMNLVMSRAAGRGQLAYAEAGNVVEQAVGSIRTVSYCFVCVKKRFLFRIFDVICLGCGIHGGETSDGKL